MYLMKSKYYLLAGLILRIDSETGIKDSAMYSEFYSARGQPDITVKITEAPLPVKNGEGIAVGGSRELYSGEGGERLYSSFYTPRGYVDYACRIIKKDCIELYIDFEGGLWDSMVFNALNIPEILADRGIFLCHSSFIIYRGEAVLFLSDKGGGKSTQASLWARGRGAEIVNGDRSLLKYEGGRLVACGTPYCGSSKTALNKSVPVRALILLEKGEKNEIRKASGTAALTGIAAQLSRETRQSAAAFEFAAGVCSSTGVYKMKCVPDLSAVEALEEILWQV